ncbi:MAG: glycosyltransferase [Thaumarchaeota archaeon]|nr:glycosyltransferase [Nitrososphaerota archaeon]
MKILSVCERLQDDAYSWRVKNILGQLGVHGNSVKLVENYSLSRQNWLSKMFHFPVSMVRTLGEACGDSYDLIYGNSQAMAYCLLGGFGRIPLVFDMHGFPAEEYRLQSLAYGKAAARNPSYLGRVLANRLELALSDTIVCVSKTQMIMLGKSYRIPREKMVYATNGVDVSFFTPHSNAETRDLRKSIGLDGKLVFGYIGSVDKSSNNWLGVQQVIKTAQAIQDSEVGFLIVGGRASQRSGNLVIVKRQPRDRLNEYYAACDVLVLPLAKHTSMNIASPTKFAEYAAVGRPIMSTDVGDPPDFIRRSDCGMIIPDFETDTMIEAIMRFKEMSSGRLNQMGARSRILAEQSFDWNKIGVTLSKALLKYQR